VSVPVGPRNWFQLSAAGRGEAVRRRAARQRMAGNPGVVALVYQTRNGHWTAAQLNCQNGRVIVMPRQLLILLGLLLWLAQSLVLTTRTATTAWWPMSP
jgi:hypothetical protein